MKYQNYIEGSLGKTDKKVGQGGSKLDKVAGCENLQLAKFHSLRNSTDCEIFVTLQNFYSVPNLPLFAPFSF